MGADPDRACRLSQMDSMQLRLIRNATMVLTYAGHTILTDPYFAPQFSLPTYAGRSLNPLVALPLTPETILTGVEKVIVSHRHSDHFDTVAQKLLPKTLALYCQPFDTQYIRAIGFVAVTPIDDVIDWDSMHITRVGGHHGLGRVEEQMGTVSGSSCKLSVSQLSIGPATPFSVIVCAPQLRTGTLM